MSPMIWYSRCMSSTVFNWIEKLLIHSNLLSGGRYTEHIKNGLVFGKHTSIQTDSKDSDSISSLRLYGILSLIYYKIPPPFLSFLSLRSKRKVGIIILASDVFSDKNVSQKTIISIELASDILWHFI